MDRQKIGKDAEQQAQKYLRQQGLRIVETNFHCRFGEIDIIALEQSTLVFIEVRARRHQGWGGASASVDLRKQRKISKAAAFFLTGNNRFHQWPCRFDVIAYENPKCSNSGDSCPVWYKDAFRPESTF